MEAPLHGTRPIDVAVITAIFVVGLAVAILLARPAPVGAQGSATPPVEASNQLQELSSKLEDARRADGKKVLGKDFEQQIDDAIRLKHRFVKSAFGPATGQTLFGCTAASVIDDLERIDVPLNEAPEEEPARRDALLKKAVKAAEELGRTFEGDACPGARNKHRAAIDHIQGDINAYRRGDTSRGINFLGPDALMIKLKMLKGQQVYGCEVTEYYELIAKIDGKLAAVNNVDRKEPRAVNRRRNLVASAEVTLADLIEKWTLVPCGETETPPPPDGPFTVEDRLSWDHPNGFGNPPSRECSRVSTSPAQPGAQVTDVITQPNPQPQVTKTATTNGSGDAVISMNIDQTGTYTHQTTVTSQSGVQATDTESQTVTSAPTGANGPCPAPTP